VDCGAKESRLFAHGAPFHRPRICRTSSRVAGGLHRPLGTCARRGTEQRHHDKLARRRGRTPERPRQRRPRRRSGLRTSARRGARSQHLATGARPSGPTRGASFRPLLHGRGGAREKAGFDECHAYVLSAIGLHALTKGDWDEADRFSSSALKTFRRLATSKPTWFDVWVVHGLRQRGRLETARGNKAAAESIFQEAEAICREGLRRVPGRDDGLHRTMLSELLIGHASIRQDLGDPEGAIRCYEEAGEILTDLTPGASTLDRLSIVAVTFSNLSVLRLDSGCFAEAREALRRSIAAWRFLRVHDPQRHDRYLARDLMKLGFVCWKLNEPSEVAAAYEEVIPLYRSMQRSEDEEENLAQATKVLTLMRGEALPPIPSR
jgi:tetratricopeptide (TPR) repeat protein